MSVFFRKYNVTLDGSTAGSFKIRIPLRKAGLAAFATGSDWTPAAGDVKLSKDGGAEANIGNLPTYSNGAWEFVLTATELSAKVVSVRVSDAAVDDELFTVETFGDVAAMWPSNYAGILLTSGTGDDQLNVSAGMVEVGFPVAVGSVEAGAITGDSISASALNGKGDWATTGAAMTLTEGERTSIGTAVWASTTRTLSSFGTLVANVWESAARTLTAFAFTPTPSNAADTTAIKAKTDLLPASPAATSDIPSAATIASATAAQVTTDHGSGSYVRNTEPDNTSATAAAAVAAKLNTALELDGSVYRFTTNALEQAPSGGGSSLTAQQVRDAMALATNATVAADSIDSYLIRLQTGRVVARTTTTDAGRHLVFVRGDDYTLASNQYPEWTDEGGNWPTLTGGTVTFTMRPPGHGTPALTKTGVIVTGSGSNKTVRVYPTAAETGALHPGIRIYAFDLQATLSTGDIVTLLMGTCSVLDDVTR